MQAALPIVVATLLAMAAATADAQCAFEHPRRAVGLRTALTQAMTPCDFPNDTTEGGVPSCSPPATFNEQNSRCLT